jgi:hypothetical protein
MNIRQSVDKYNRKTSQYIVAYLDILGIASRMAKNKKGKELSLNKLHNLYIFAIELTKKTKGIDFLRGIKFKIFSDNIIIAKKLSLDPFKRISDIYSVFNCVSHFQCLSVGDGVGWLVRGGITIGELFINNLMVWGSARLRAYELENNIASYPRVVIDYTMLPELKSYTKMAPYLLSDSDGVVFLNYMNIWHFSGKIVKLGFDEMKNETIKPDGSYPDKIYQKLYWHMNYINCELDKKNELRDKKYRLTLN